MSMDLHRYSMTLQEINVCILTTLSKELWVFCGIAAWERSHKLNIFRICTFRMGYSRTFFEASMGFLRHCSLGKESQFDFFPSLYLQNGFVAHSPLFNQLGIRSEQSRRDPE